MNLEVSGSSEQSEEEDEKQVQAKVPEEQSPSNVVEGVLDELTS